MTVQSVPTAPTQRSYRQWLTQLIPYIGMFIIALMLWLPFGFKTTGLIEELSITQTLDAGNRFYFITPDSVMSISRSRPLQMFFFTAAYVLDPDSYQFYNIFMLLFFFGKIVVMYWLVLQFLPGKKLLAFITGVLFMLYPADTGLFALRVIHVHSAILAYLLAVYLLIQFYKWRGWKSVLALFISGILVIFSLGQYQIALAAAIITPLILLYFGRPNRRFFIAAVGWYASSAIILLYEVWAAKQPGIEAYEAVLMPTADLASNPFRSLATAVLVGYQRQISTWSAAFNKLNDLPTYGFYIAIGLLTSIIVGWLLLRQEPSEANAQPISWQRYLLVFLTGIVLFPIGMATYLPLPNYRFEDFRIYLLAMIGSAIVLVLLLYFISRLIKRYREVLFLILALPFIGLGLLSALTQQQRYVNYSLTQQNVLQKMVAQAPQLAPNTSVVIIDPAGILKRAYVFYYGSLLQPTVSYLYSDPTIQVFYCPVYGGTDDSQTCQFKADGLHIRSLPSPLPYSQLLLFMTGDNGEVKLLSSEDAAATLQIPAADYVPASHIIGTQPPHRASTMFSCVPALSCYHEPNDNQSVISNGSFDLPSTTDIGFGWRELEVNSQDETFHWSVNRTSTVDINLSANGDLNLEFKVLYWMDEGLINSLKLSINGQDIPLTFKPSEPRGRIYHAVIPQAALTGRPSRTQLVFTTDYLVPVINDPNTQLGFALSWLHIRPAQ